MKTEFVPELILDPHEAAALALMTGQDGWKVYHKIARHEVEQFVVALINIPSGNNDQVVEGHRVAKTAAQFYEGVTRKVNRVVEGYATAHKVEGPPVDITEGLIDLGPAASTEQDFDLDTGFEESLD